MKDPSYLHNLPDSMKTREVQMAEELRKTHERCAKWSMVFVCLRKVGHEGDCDGITWMTATDLTAFRSAIHNWKRREP